MRSDDLGKLLLRASVGVLILLHGIAKIGSGPAMIANMLRERGWPGGFAWLVYVGEVVAPLLLIAGLWTRAAALVVAFNMFAAVYLVHLNELGVLGRGGGWAIELQAMYFLAAIAIALLGAGRWSIGGAGGRFN